jgi:hypothetical protein
MPGITCPACSARILIDDVHMADGSASCRACGRGYRLGQLVGAAAGRPAPERLGVPPSGCRLQDRDGTVRIIASMRSPGRAVVVLLAAIFWNAITWVFVLIAAAALWVHLVGPVPAWVPGPLSGKPHPMPLFMAIFLAVFIMPFVGIGIWLICNVAVFCAGHLSVTLVPGSVVTFVGVGPIGRRRRIALAPGGATVRIVRVRGEEQGQRAIQIGTSKKSRFGELLAADRREWVAATLRDQLARRGRDAPADAA